MSKVSITVHIPQNNTFGVHIVEKDVFERWFKLMSDNIGHEFDQPGYEDLTAYDVLSNYITVVQLNHECDEIHIGDSLPIIKVC